MLKKGQAESIIIFFFLIVAILVVSIILLRLTNAIVTPFKNQINMTSPQAYNAVNFVQERFTSWWDIAIILIFAFNIITLLVSAFLIDIHPAFVIIYIVSILFLFVFGNYALLALDSIWNAVGTDVEQAQTPLQQFLINNFTMIMLGVIILSGIVMYAKIKMFSNMGAGGGNY